jgi:hypothetical protein
MTVKEFKALSASKVIALIPVEGEAYDVYHNRTQETYVFADNTADDREIEFIEAEQDDNSDYSVIYVYTK